MYLLLRWHISVTMRRHTRLLIALIRRCVLLLETATRVLSLRHRRAHMLALAPFVRTLARGGSPGVRTVWPGTHVVVLWQRIVRVLVLLLIILKRLYIYFICES